MSKTRKIVFVIVVITSMFIMAHSKFASPDIEYKAPEQVIETKAPTRQETVKALINQLQAERENDPTFKAKTAEMEQELEQEIANMRKALAEHRKAQSRLDALTIVQVQYDMELSALEKFTE